MKHSKAFTLTELLVVIPVITLLAFLLLPALKDASETARRANCASNLKQIQLAISMYADRYQRRVPWDGTAAWVRGGVGSCQPSFSLLSNELTSAKVFACPSTSEKPATGYPLGWTNVSYCLAPLLIWNDTPDSILAFDRMSNIGNGDVYSARSTWTAISPHKTAGGNVLFNDGHVSWQTALPSTPGTNGNPFALRP